MRTSRFLALLVAMLVFASACSSDADPETSEGDQSAESGDSENTGSEDGTDGGSEGSSAAAGDARFVYANPFPIFDLDPSSAFSSENVVLQNVYETLTTFNPPGSAELVSPSLAESWTSNDDATEWTFTLREGVTFHDGTPHSPFRGRHPGPYSSSSPKLPAAKIRLQASPGSVSSSSH